MYISIHVYSCILICSITSQGTACSRKYWSAEPDGERETYILFLFKVFIAFFIFWGQGQVRTPVYGTFSWPGKKRLTCCRFIYKTLSLCIYLPNWLSAFWQTVQPFMFFGLGWTNVNRIDPGTTVVRGSVLLSYCSNTTWTYHKRCKHAHNLQHLPCDNDGILSSVVCNPCNRRCFWGLLELTSMLHSILNHCYCVAHEM